MRPNLLSALFFCCFLFSGAFPAWGATVSAPRVVAIATAPHAVAVADLNADGTPDIVVAGLQGQVQVVLHRSDQSFQTSAIYQIHDALTSVVVLPPSSDTKAGVALATQTGKVYFLSGNGDGTFGDPSSPVSVSSSVTSIALADPNSLGHSRIVALDSAGIAYLIDPDALTSQAVASVPGATRIHSADFDRDGYLDMAFASPTGVFVAIGKGNGAFAAPVSISSGSAVSLTAADLDGLGISTLIASDAHGTLTFLTPAARVFQTVSQLKTESADFAAADLDQDGKADLIVSNPVTHEVAFYRGLGQGQFANVQEFGAGSPMTALAAAAGMAGLVSDRSGVVAVLSSATPIAASNPLSSTGSSSSSSSSSQFKGTGAATPASSTTVSLSATPNPGAFGHAVVFTATVSAAPGRRRTGAAAS